MLFSNRNSGSNVDEVKYIVGDHSSAVHFVGGYDVTTTELTSNSNFANIDQIINEVDQTMLGSRSRKTTNNRKTITSQQQWVESTYESLKQTWSNYSIAIPRLAQLTKRLNRAYEIRLMLEAHNPELKGNLSPILVPPSTQLSMEKLALFRKVQGLAESSDSFGKDTLMNKSTRWQVLLVDTAQAGLWGNAKKLLLEQKYMVGDWDARALGVLEYMAMTLQMGHLIDESAWTLLLKNYEPNIPQSLLAARYSGGSYQYEVTDPENIFDDEYLRVAIEVKA